MADKNTALIPEQGWHCLHLFYRIEFAQWQLLSAEEQRAAKVTLSSLVQEVHSIEKTQLLTLSMVTPLIRTPWIWLSSCRAAHAPSSLTLAATVVKPADSASGASPKPTTETSCGTPMPSARSTSSAAMPIT